MAVQYYEGIGRRKRSIARVRLQNGTGNFFVNGKSLHEFFTRLGDVENILATMDKSDLDPGQFDVSVLVKGGGVTGQSDSVRLGLARALISMNADLQPIMKKAGFLTRDPRVKERKKPGLKRARKAPTYTKR